MKNKKIMSWASLLLILSLMLSQVLWVEAIASEMEPYEGLIVVIPDESTPPQVSYGGYVQATPINPDTRSASGPVYYYQSKVELLGGSCYSESWTVNKTNKYPIDFIEAEVTIYDDGCVAGGREDFHYNSYTARASVNKGSLSIVCNREVYGYHRFEESGYETVETESYAKVFE